MAEFRSHLPLLVLHTSGEPIKFQRIKGRISVMPPVEGKSTLQGKPEFQGHCEFWVRGSSTRTKNKRPYRLEIQDESGDDLKVELLGMPKDSDWVLHASWFDHTFIRDRLAYDLWNAMGYYAPRSRYVELFIVQTNGAAGPQVQPTMAEYQGIYLLTEKVKRGKDRVDIQKLGRKDDIEPGVTGGYIFKKDPPDFGESGFRSGRGILFSYDEPQYQEITLSQSKWLTNHVAEFEKVLFSDSFRDKTNGYAKFIAVDTFVDYHWMVEISANIDGYQKSLYLHKDRGGPLKMGPLWDWDISFGNTSIAPGKPDGSMEGWQWERVRRRDYSWFNRLFEDPDFLQRYIDRWQELRTNVFATSNIWARIDHHAREVDSAVERNFRRWDTFDRTYDFKEGIPRYYQGKVDELKRWIKGRLAWIDNQGFPPPEVARQKTPSGGTELALKCQVGTIFHTTDGSDPRVSGGGVSPRAKHYQAPLVAKSGERICARVRSDQGIWSPLVLVDSL